MKLHRFYTGLTHDKWGPIELNHLIWVNDKHLLDQWLRIFKFKPGDKLVLFNDQKERIYQIIQIEYPHSVHLKLVTDQERNLPKKHVYLFWVLRDKDDDLAAIKAATKAGIKNIILIKLGNPTSEIDINYYHQQIIKTCEQSGRADIPEIRQPIVLNEIFTEYGELPIYLCKNAESEETEIDIDKFGIIIGPKNGWLQNDTEFLVKNNIKYIDIANLDNLKVINLIASIARIVNI